MSSMQYASDSLALMNRKFTWHGIFSGTFLFLAIEATFGVLGAAIFGSMNNATNAAGTSAAGPNVGVGAGIWMVVLTIIALYFSGRLASSSSAAATRNAGMYAGLVTYGMSIFAAVLVAALDSTAFGTAAAHTGFAATNFIIPGGYWLFAAMILGAIAAAFGGVHGASAGGLRTMERTTTETKRVA